MRVAAIRPDEINLPLFLHVLGAMLLVGTLLAIALATVIAWRRSDDTVGLTRFSLLTLLAGVVPSYVLMRIGAQWTEAEQDYPEDFEPAWLGIGYITADVGALLILVSIVLSTIGLREAAARSGNPARTGRRRDLDPAAPGVPRRRVGDDRQADLAPVAFSSARSLRRCGGSRLAASRRSSSA